jgi:hypothetical protein
MAVDAVIRPASRIVYKLVNKMKIRCKYCDEITLIENIDTHNKLCLLPKCHNPLCRKPLGDKKSSDACSNKCKLIYEFSKEFDQMKEKPILEVVDSFITKYFSQDSQGKNEVGQSPQIAIEEEKEVSSEKEFQEEYREFIWNKDVPYKYIEFSIDGRIVNNIESEMQFRNIYGSIGFTGGKHYWEIVTDSKNMHDMKIGISKKIDYGVGAFSDNLNGWAYYSIGELRHGNNTNGKKYGKKFKMTGIIGVCLNMIDGTLQFSLNGEIFPVAFNEQSLKEGPIYPAISILRNCIAVLVTGKAVPDGFYFK